MKTKRIVVSLFAAGVMASPLAHATDGYFSHGYGMKAKGMGGAGIALPQDTLAAATNPAGMVMVGDRVDLGVDWFKPNRNTNFSAPQVAPMLGDSSGNGDSSFLIPEFGFNKMLSADSSFGISVYGNGGMNTKYKDLNARMAAAAFPFTFGTGDVGVDLSQLFIAPTYAMKLNADNAIGVSLNLAYQMFKAEGLQNFGIMNPGYDSSTGWGVRIGWTGQVSPMMTLGATYQTKTKMSKFSKYAGLFAEQGGFDIPANYGIGIAAKLSDTTTLAVDIEQIQYSGVASIANPITNFTVLGNAFGSTNGPGFGWRDMTALKLGVSHQYDSNLVLRAGYNTGRQPIPETETLFNILAPGVVQDHLTLGATWTMPSNSELTVGYMHAFKNTVTGTGATGSGVNLNMYQDSLGVAYGWKM